MTIRAFAIPETIPHDSVAAAQTFFRMTGHALELFVCTFERIVCQLGVIESLDLESLRDVARVAVALRRGESKLPGMHVAMAPRTLTGSPAVRSTATTRPVLLGRAMATVAGGVRVRPGEGPNAMVDPRRIPAARRVAMSTAVLFHLRRKLVAVRIVVAIDAALCFELEVVVGAFALVTAGAGDRGMFAVEREFGVAVLRHRERGRPKSLLVVA